MKLPGGGEGVYKCGRRGPTLGPYRYDHRTSHRRGGKNRRDLAIGVDVEGGCRHGTKQDCDCANKARAEDLHSSATSYWPNGRLTEVMVGFGGAVDGEKIRSTSWCLRVSYAGE